MLFAGRRAVLAVTVVMGVPPFFHASWHVQQRRVLLRRSWNNCSPALVVVGTAAGIGVIGSRTALRVDGGRFSGRLVDQRQQPTTTVAPAVVASAENNAGAGRHDRDIVE
jgi:hypothetical protein